MDPKSASHKRPSSALSDMQEFVLEPIRNFSNTAVKSNSGANISTTPSGFTQGTFHNYPEEDKIATNIYNTLPSPNRLHTLPNPEGYLRMLETSQNIYRNTPNGVRVKFADGSTQLQFPGRLYISDVCGLAKRTKVPGRKCARYVSSVQITHSLFTTPIRYPKGGQPVYGNVHSSPPNRQTHHPAYTLMVQCAAVIPIGGIYFGPDSQYNRSYRDPNPPEDDRRLGAELEVTKHAVRVAREVATSKTLIQVVGQPFTKIVVMTSSERVVRGITEFLSHWRRMNWWGLDALFFPEVEANRHRWESLDNAIGKAMEDGLEVDLWLVPEEDVRGAIDLAESAMVKFSKKKKKKAQNSPDTRAPVCVAKVLEGPGR